MSIARSVLTTPSTILATAACAASSSLPTRAAKRCSTRCSTRTECSVSAEEQQWLRAPGRRRRRRPIAIDAGDIDDRGRGRPAARRHRRGAGADRRGGDIDAGETTSTPGRRGERRRRRDAPGVVSEDAQPPLPMTRAETARTTTVTQLWDSGNLLPAFIRSWRRAAAAASMTRQYGRTGLTYCTVVGCSGQEQSHMQKEAG